MFVNAANSKVRPLQDLEEFSRYRINPSPPYQNKDMEVKNMYTSPRISTAVLLAALLGVYWVSQLAGLWNRGTTIEKIVFIAGGVLVSYLMLNGLVGYCRKGVRRLNEILETTSIDILLGGIAGLLLGIMVGVLSTYPLSMLRGWGHYLIIAVFLICGALGVKIGTSRASELFSLLPFWGSPAQYPVEEPDETKVLDTSAIIDGRIYDVCQSNFLDGKLIVPTFVIEELQHIADSSDNLRRNKGRRGLELLSKMQKHPQIKIDIIEADILEERDVDAKLVKLCKRLNASIITNDFNLNKVSELQGIKVLNINELANAVKMIVYPGENMHISIIKEGKESGQGVGYLEDGTMVVVEDAQNDIGRDLDVVVTSVFQTAAGRMIFTRKSREDHQHHAHHLESQVQAVREVNLYG
jgi:uncharacterized protein YacL